MFYYDDQVCSYVDNPAHFRPHGRLKVGRAEQYSKRDGGEGGRPW